ncbi:MAG: hypothetical protein KDB65_07185 [Calditrichaeota bacterium]|nr:hypothetical protein [Calditrichota bacterium]MCB9369620.1 hypothetical protein [Calditrichota bacterium]
MRWILLLGSALFICFGCDEDNQDKPFPASRIVIVEAPASLPFLEEWWNPQPYESTAVRFIVEISPDVSDVDTIVCNVYDQLGGKVDSFLLLDDGSAIEHWDISPCETAITGDSIANDRHFTRDIHAEDFTANYAGAEYTFSFYAVGNSCPVFSAEYAASTWAPMVELVSAAITPSALPPCGDSMIVYLTLRHDIADSIEGVELGFDFFDGNINHPITHFSPISGDSMWRAAVSGNSDIWQEFNGLSAGYHTKFGLLETFSLGAFYSIPLPEASLQLTADTFQLHHYQFPETLWVLAEISLCDSSTTDRVAATYSPLSAMSHWRVETPFLYLTDCPINGDQHPRDGIFTGFSLITADSLAQPYSAPIRIEAGTTWSHNPCFGTDMINSLRVEKTIVLLPPQ